MHRELTNEGSIEALVAVLFSFEANSLPSFRVLISVVQPSVVFQSFKPGCFASSLIDLRGQKYCLCLNLSYQSSR